MNKKCYLLTGAAGRLGRCFVKILCERNIDGVTDLKLVDLHFNPELRNKQAALCKEAKIDVEWIEGSITDQAIFPSILNGVDVVVHMASVVDFRDDVSMSTLWRVNVEGTRTLVSGCCKMNLSFFLYTSSGESYGTNEECQPLYDIDEDTSYLGKPSTRYAKTKRVAEDYVVASHNKSLNNGKGHLAFMAAEVILR
ncbi:unnamed protein product [Clavelina lepadiformis]|uniref:3-beta hydroxysteroid dehydrogenase/isomerase domain-containing protein n=1 Tax=Clavelina lepadiformis TaxID=159417 RepID=A0ABP0G5E8_CLALP